MPSHLANWIKEEKAKIKARNKSLDELLKRDDIGRTVNYHLVTREIIMKGCKDCKEGKCAKHMRKKK